MRGGLQANILCLNSALGTPLEWPEAKKNANHVRDWGIKVYLFDSGMRRLAAADVYVCAAITSDME